MNKDCIEINVKVTNKSMGNERKRCAKIVQEIWKKKPVKYEEVVQADREGDCGGDIGGVSNRSVWDPGDH